MKKEYEIIIVEDNPEDAELMIRSFITRVGTEVILLRLGF